MHMNDVTRVDVQEARETVDAALRRLGYDEEKTQHIRQNLLEAQMAGKQSHGVERLLHIRKQLQDHCSISNESMETLTDKPSLLHVDAQGVIGYHAIYKTLPKAMQKAQQTGIAATALKDIGQQSGYIGDYARRVANNDLIYYGAHNSLPNLIPHGASEPLWGTNPWTIGVPTRGTPVILDMSSTKVSWGHLHSAANNDEDIKNGLAMNEDGEPTTSPEKAMKGGLLPIAGPKGSGLGLTVELLAGPLTGSQIAGDSSGRRGSFYVIIDPSAFRDLDAFKADVQDGINELKNAETAEGTDAIHYPGEQSQAARQQAKQRGEITVSEDTWNTVSRLATPNS